METTDNMTGATTDAATDTATGTPSTDTAAATATTATLVAGRGGLFDVTAGRPLLGGPVAAVAAGESALWAIVDGAALYRVVDGVAERVAALPTGTGSCVVEHLGDVFVGGDEARLWRLDGDRFERVAAFDAAPTRAEWHTPWGGPPDVYSFAAHGHDLHVSVHVGGILRTSDGGASFEPTIDLHDDVHQVVVDARTGTVWAATGASGLAESRDGGDTWRYHTDGLHATYLLAVAVTDAGVIVGASSGHAGRDGALYVFADGTFHRAAGLPDRLDGAVGPRRLAGAGDHAAVVLPDGSLFGSGDGGASWEPVAGRRFDGATEVALAS